MSILLAVLLSSLAPRAALINGVALTPHFEDAARGLDFDRMVDEIAALGASHVSIVVQWSQRDVRATSIAPHPTESQPDAVIRRLMRRARAKGLEVMVFPILWVEQRALGEWRGTLKPQDEPAWWRAYRRFILHYADLAAAEGASVFSVGSELASLESRTERWRALIADVRSRFGGRVLYSANWDHYAEVTFWDQVDLIGLTGYYRLTESKTPTGAELNLAWAAVRDTLVRWQATHAKPLVFTELGYPSSDGAARSPWDYTTGAPVDLEEQRLCYEAFYAAWIREPALGGVVFWNWWGPGGPKDGYYTPRGKPAEEVIRRWFKRRRMFLDAEKDVR